MSACHFLTSLSQMHLSNDIVILRGLGVTVSGADTFSTLCHKQADLGLWCLLSHQSLSVSLDFSFMPETCCLKRRYYKPRSESFFRNYSIFVSNSFACFMPV